MYITSPKTCIFCSQMADIQAMKQQRLILLVKTAKESHSAIHNTSFGTFKAKIGQLHSSQSMFEFP